MSCVGLNFFPVLIMRTGPLDFATKQWVTNARLLDTFQWNGQKSRPNYRPPFCDAVYTFDFTWYSPEKLNSVLSLTDVIYILFNPPVWIHYMRLLCLVMSHFKGKKWIDRTLIPGNRIMTHGSDRRLSIAVTQNIRIYDRTQQNRSGHGPGKFPIPA